MPSRFHEHTEYTPPWGDNATNILTTLVKHSYFIWQSVRVPNAAELREVGEKIPNAAKIAFVAGCVCWFWQVVIVYGRYRLLCRDHLKMD
jgi:hypothetical protein